MGIINILDKHTANLIAAGEVVERPAAAVKEMLENSADAGAKNITVEIKDGGTTFIRIADDGCGMTREDVPKTILRHATSKIKSGSDLDAIATLGFRGEALAAISSVSELKILTKRKEDIAGTLFVCSFGEVITTDDAGCPDGTTIIVENLFENTPARRKFLKKNTTEATAVYAVCEKFAISRPEIAVKLISDGNVKMQTPGDGKLLNAIYASIGREFTNALLEVSYELDGVKVYGYITKPEATRPNRNMQNFFVNGRYIKSRTMLAALEEGFRGFCPASKFPGCVIFLEIALNLVDVNIHPAKLEIKFSDDRKIFDCIYFATKNALSKGISEMFSYTSAVYDNIPREYLEKDNKTEAFKPSSVKNDIKPEYKEPTKVNFVAPEKTSFFEKSVSKKDDFVTEKLPEIPIEKQSGTQNEEKITSSNDQNDNSIKITANYPEVMPIERVAAEELPIITKKEEKPVEKTEIYTQEQIISPNEFIKPIYIGEVFDTYIVVQRGKCMYLIDKHAAHERIIYERIKNARDNNDAQYLLEPTTITLVPKEAQAVRDNMDYFTKIGFDADEFGDTSFLIRSIPGIVDISDIKDIFTFLAGKLAEGNTRSAGEIFDRALYTAACKAAIKAGDKFTENDNKKIITEIFENDAVLYCPHGRPVICEFTKDKIEKMFGRQ